MKRQLNSNGQLAAKLVSTALAIITMLGLLAVPGKAATTYTIDVTDYYGSVAVTGRGYSHDGASTLTFNTAANGNDYVIKRDSGVAGSVKNIVFPAGVSPNSVTFRGLVYATSITFPAGFNADLSFQKNGLGEYVELSAALTIPTGYSGNLDINGLSVPSLTLPSDHPGPITFNCLTVTSTNGLIYPTNYNGPITIGGSFNVKGNQFPTGYSGPITIGDSGGAFTNQQTICRPGTSLLSGIDGIFIPNNISTLTINNAKTSGSGRLNIKLGATDSFELLLAGSSDVNGYIEVPSGAKLTIDSKASTTASPHSESGRLAIAAPTNTTAIGISDTTDNGTITINGGTVEATGPAAGIGGGSGQVTINGGKTVATCTGSGAGIGSNSNNIITTVAHITINGGTVIASANGDGAGIGSGSGATGGYPDNTTSVGAVIEINGGTVTGNGGDVERIYLGSGNYNGAGIGGGKGACADVTITGGHVTANSMHGAGIGNGSGGGTAVRGSVAITDGTIKGYTMDGSNIGAGVGSSYRPTYLIDKKADILMCSRWFDPDDPGSIVCGGSNLAQPADRGYFVSAFSFKQRINGDIYVFDAATSALARVLPIPYEDVVYMSFLFSTGHNYPEQFHIFTDLYGDYPNHTYYGMRQYVHHYDHRTHSSGSGPSTHVDNNPVIPSVTNMKSYPHNFVGAWVNSLIVCFGDPGEGTGGTVFYRVTEKYVDIDGNPIPGQSDTTTTVASGTTYAKPIPAISGYNLEGHKWGTTPPSGAGTYTPGNPSKAITGNETIYFVYDAIKTDVTISKILVGDFSDRTKPYDFTVTFRDATGKPLPQGKQFDLAGGGKLTLDVAGSAPFSLAHGQSITITGLNPAHDIRIAETIDANAQPAYTAGKKQRGS